MTKTYHTLKDIISSKFKSSKDNEDKTEETGLNNVTEELRKSGRSHDKVADDVEQKKTAGEQGIYGKPRTTDPLSIQQHQYNQHIIQQHIIAQQNQHYPNQSPYKNQMYPQQQQQLVQARSQEILTQRQDEQCYYQNSSYNGPQQRRYNAVTQNRDNYLPIHHQQQQHLQQYETINERCVDDRKPNELRSPQQLERDNMRQKHFEARRAASQPQLAGYDDEQKKIDYPNHRAQPQTSQIQPTRRGSHGNIMESTKEPSTNEENEKDSDDGGFLKRNNSEERHDEEQKQLTDNKSEEDNKMMANTLLLSGSPRKRLEGEIGKIEGVYNVTQQRKQQTGSGASSDYDKNGPSSSNADSGRGSAAYSSGRRPGVDTSNESEPQVINNGNYRETTSQG